MYNKTQLFVHGGFEPEFASQPLETMAVVDLGQVFAREGGRENGENRQGGKENREVGKEVGKEN